MILTLRTLWTKCLIPENPSHTFKTDRQNPSHTFKTERHINRIFPSVLSKKVKGAHTSLAEFNKHTENWKRYKTFCMFCVPLTDRTLWQTQWWLVHKRFSLDSKGIRWLKRRMKLNPLTNYQIFTTMIQINKKKSRINSKNCL